MRALRALLCLEIFHREARRSLHIFNRSRQEHWVVSEHADARVAVEAENATDGTRLVAMVDVRPIFLMSILSVSG
jgi:hypothetical protein